MNIDTLCLHAGYRAKSGGPHVLPIEQSTTFEFATAGEAAALFDLSANGHLYSRISNPTVAAVEEKIAALEGGSGALCTSSGQAATLLSILNIAGAGDHILCAQTVYGGTVNLLAQTIKKFGIEVTFVDQTLPLSELQKALKPNTKAVFGETLANPSLTILPFEKMAALAHGHGIPLIVDNTFASPILCRPFEHGADIVVHSATKYMDGHGVVVIGVIIDGGRFDWANGKFPGLTEPDASYHGVSYVRDFGNAAYITKARAQLMRDLGVGPQALTAFLLNMGLETLAIRMERHSQSADRIAREMQNHPKIESVRYPTLYTGEEKILQERYLPSGASGIVTLVIKGGREAAVRFIEHLKLAPIAIHVATARSMVLHPASTSHRQLSDERLLGCGIKPGLVRFSVGLENVEDILEDIKQALDA